MKMRSSLKDVFVIIILTLIFIGCYYVGDYTIKTINKNSFISSAKELYKAALESKKEEDVYFDSNSKTLPNEDLKYHIEFDKDGKITYFLAYDNKNAIEISNSEVKLEDIKIEKDNYADLTDVDTSDNVTYKHSLLNNKYTEDSSDTKTLPTQSTTDKSNTITDKPNTTDTDKPSTTTDTDKPSTTTTETENPNTSTTEKPSTTENTKPSTSATEKPSTTTDKPNTSTSANTPITYEITHTKKCTIDKGYYEGESEGKYVYTVSMGGVPNSCYDVKITNVEIDSKSNANVTIEYTYPDINRTCAQMSMYPCTSVIFSRKPNKINPITYGGGFDIPRERDTYEIEQEETTEVSPLIVEENQGTLTYQMNNVYNCSDITTKGYNVKISGGKYTLNIGMGKANKGGYKVKLSEIKIDKSNNVTVKTVTEAPNPKLNTTDAINYPCLSITFDKSPKSYNIYMDNVKLGMPNME